MPTLSVNSVFTPADHVAMLVLTAGLTAAAVLAARCGLERGVRRTLAAAGVLIYVGSGLYFTLSPVEMNAQGHIKLEESLPIQACDLLALIAPMALIWRGRVLRAVAYFGALGLTTQAFFTPVIDTGPETAKFWVFWLLHMSIVICVVFDLVVGGYRPRLGDLGRAVGFWFIYAVAMLVLNASTGWYYGYLSREIPENAEGSVLKHLGAWPVRPVVMIGIVLVLFVALWLPWAVIYRVRQRSG